MFEEELSKFLFIKLQLIAVEGIEYHHFAIPSKIIDPSYDYHELLSTQKGQPDIVCLLVEVHTINHEVFLPKIEPESNQPLHTATQL